MGSQRAEDVRNAAVAGYFYPGNAEKIASEARRLVPAAGTRTALAVVSPHAGWKYSGALAGQLFSTVAVPRRVIVLCPNHTGQGARAALWNRGIWRLPGMEIPIDEPMCARLLQEGRLLEPDREAHEEEHAIEVLLPLLHAAQPQLRITPAVLALRRFDECVELGHAVARAVRAEGGGALIVASSDMSHFLPDAETRAIDRLAIEPMERLDPDGLFDAVERNQITMCGHIPATVAMVAARELGGRSAELLGYATSADAGGGAERVVGYAAVAFG